MSEDIVQRAAINTPDGVALFGEDGTVYVLTTEDLERHRLTDEGARRAPAPVGATDDDEVVGFAARGVDIGKIDLSGPITIGKSPVPCPPHPPVARCWPGSRTTGTGGADPRNDGTPG